MTVSTFSLTLPPLMIRDSKGISKLPQIPYKISRFTGSLEIPLISLPDDGVAPLLTEVHHRGSKSGLLGVTEPPIVTDKSEVGVEASELLHGQGALVIAQIG